jgi:uncharacterized protein
MRPRSSPAAPVTVSLVRCDLSTLEGADVLRNAVAASGRPVNVLIANAGRASEPDCVEPSIDRALIDGTIYLIYRLGRAMRDHGRGRILITGSIAELMPSGSPSVYSGAKALLASFSVALRNELRNSGVTVTCLMPAARSTN